ncbi:MAG: ABC transporter DrrB family efflux protein [Glaciecola sp.]|jgi:ABC transporter DrrB family efflux protein
MSATTTEFPTNPGNALTDTWVITKRNLVRNVRLPQLLIFSTAQPIMFLVLFNVVFGGAVGDSIPAVADGNYLNFLLPGLLVQISAFGAGQTALGLSEDLNKGVISRFRSLPMSRAAVLAGRTFADLIRSAFVMTLMLVVGFGMGFRYQTSFPRFVSGVLVVLAFSYALSWVMAVIGLKIRTPEAVQSAVFLPVFPMVFASAVFVPTDTMPSWLRGFAENQPVTAVAEAARGLILGQGALAPGQTVAGQVLIALLWCAVITVVAAPLAVRVYRQSAS